jgi:acylphosphatase
VFAYRTSSGLVQSSLYIELIVDARYTVRIMVEMTCVITGGVQGVAYRTYAQDSATELGLVGYVKNMSDGSVQVVAQGSPEVLKEFVEYLHEGSLMSEVSGVAVDWGSMQKLYSEFSIIH